MANQTMDQSATSQREVLPEREAVQRQAPAPPGWADAQGSLAAAAGLSLLLVAGHQPPALAVSNNNSICQAFQSSPTHGHRCEPYCGQAYQRALDAGTVTHYRCHAGLHCIAMPVDLHSGRQLAVIGGRAFLTIADYRALAERFRTGDLQDLLSPDLFRNVIFAARQDLDDLARRIAATAREYDPQAAVQPAGPASAPSATAESNSPEASSSHNEEASVRGAIAENPASASERTINEVSRSAVEALASKHNLTSVALLLREKSALIAAFATGRLSAGLIRIELPPEEAGRLLADPGGASFPLRETAAGFTLRGNADEPRHEEPENITELFPLVVGDEVKGALLVGDTPLSEAKRQAIARFCHEVALPLEILRLQKELERRTRFADYLQSFTERINSVEPEKSYQSILQQSAELLHAERGSLLLFDETSNELAVKAAVGLNAQVASEARVRLGDGISGGVLKNGRPLVVRDLESAGHTPAPAERRYKTKSFISYPITIGGRKVGVLNVTDKMGGGSYDESDLSLLETIAPQMALALDRAEWQEKATQFQIMSITDSLTGLLNRRYLEERLAEELKRSKREQYAMSFMMIDIDDFKLYNDRNGHQAGDLALEMTAHCLKSALRGADVAARYGGEEFCILLPQTAPAEASAIAERIRLLIARTCFPHGKAQPLGAVTISIGVSSFTPLLDTPGKIIGAADRALYIAKHQGKNRAYSLDNIQSDDSTSDAARDAS